jgi:RHS repeat-associated protein
MQGNASIVFARSHYQYDKVNREVATWRDGPQDEAGSKGERFWFETNNQIKKAYYKADYVWTATPSTPATYREYTYTADKLNWSSVNDNGYNAPFVANDLNQYTSVNGSVPHYDNRFNLDQFWGMNYNHNSANQLISVTGSHSASFTYDGLGRCVRRTVDGQTRIFAYDGWNAIVEWDQSGNFMATNLYGPKADEILGRYDAVYGSLIYKQDKQGNVTFVLDPSNQTVEKYSYDAYGQPTIMDGAGAGRSQSAIGNRFMYTGREWIGELGLYDYRHRYYLPSIGRFIETDLMGLQTEGEKLSAGQKALFSPGGSAPEAFSSSEMNLFRYCGDDPVDNSDPSGLEVIPYNGPPIPIDTLRNGAGLGATGVDPVVIPHTETDGTITLRLETRITGIVVANRVKFHGVMRVRSQAEKDVTFNEHEKGEHGKDWHKFDSDKTKELPTTRYKDPDAAARKATELSAKFTHDAYIANKDFEKHQPESRWKPIRDRELPQH